MEDHGWVIMKRIALTFVAAALVGCTSNTIVNIPPQVGDTAFHNPGSAGVKQIMLTALRAVLVDRPITQPFQVILPEKTPAKVYAELLPQLGQNAMWSSDGQTKGLPIVAVVQIRIRGLYAEVDMVRPQFPDQREPSEQTVTASLKFTPIDGWYVKRLKEWRGDVNQIALPPPPPKPAPKPKRQPQPAPAPAEQAPAPAAPQPMTPGVEQIY